MIHLSIILKKSPEEEVTRDDLKKQSFQDYEIISAENRVHELNKAIKKSQGSFLTFMKPGVLSETNRFAQQIDLLEDQELAAIGSPVLVVYERGQNLISYPVEFEDIYSSFFWEKKNFMFDSSVLVKKDAVISVGGMSSVVRQSEESLMTALELSVWCRIMLSGKKIKNTSEPLVKCQQKHIDSSKQYFFERDMIWGMFRRKSFVQHKFDDSDDFVFDSIFQRKNN